ncbi:hypothetical protein D3C80_2227800 [compost metagenome]
MLKLLLPALGLGYCLLRQLGCNCGRFSNDPNPLGTVSDRLLILPITLYLKAC